MYCKLQQKELDETKNCRHCIEYMSSDGTHCTWIEQTAIEEPDYELLSAVELPVAAQPLQSDIVYTVKSHQRVDRFREKTYEKVILKYGFPLENVHIFVSTEKDYKLYLNAYEECTIHLAPLGVAAVDNFITDYFDEGQKLIYMNDDVTVINKVSKVDDKLKFEEVPVEELHQCIKTMFEIMDTNDITYAGFYPVMNTMFMDNSSDWNTGLALIMDPFSLVRNNKKIKVTISDKSDFEKSIQHFADKGALLRNNRISFKAEYYGSKGGFQGRNEQTELSTAQAMQSLYPAYITGINVKDKGRTSLRLKSMLPTKDISLPGTGGKKPKPSVPTLF